jgi:hypothetical protein
LSGENHLVLLMAACLQGRGLELHSVHCNPAAPAQFCVGGADECVRVFDLRRPWLSATSASASPVGHPLRRLAPLHLRSRVTTPRDISVTCAVFDQVGNILASYNDENIYLLAAERPRARRRSGNGGGQRREGTRVRSSEGSQPMRRGPPSAVPSQAA